MVLIPAPWPKFEREVFIRRQLLQFSPYDGRWFEFSSMMNPIVNDVLQKPIFIHRLP